MSRIDWQPIVTDLSAWVEQQDGPVTLRQGFYRLVSEQVIPNSEQAYKSLSDRTARARREGWFPALADGTREVTLPATWTSPDEFAQDAVAQYRIDRWAEQDTLPVIAVEKRGMLAAYRRWFGDFGFPLVALGGYASQTLVDDVARLVAADGRESHLFIVNDFDASGFDLARDFVDRTACFQQVHRIALTAQHVEVFDLPVNPGKASDSRAVAFARKYGHRQVEVDALPPSVLRDLSLASLVDYIDEAVHRVALAREELERSELAARLGVVA